jgi:hypothetical protein
VDWVVYAKPPFGGPEQVLKYLARYTHRVAISNRRLVSMSDAAVSFRWKDYADGNAPKVMTVDGVEFVRRFLQHVLPGGFVRIRHFGFLANRCRNAKLARCRALLGTPPPAVPVTGPQAEPPNEATATDRAVDHDTVVLESPWCCPVGRVGRMVIVETIPRQLSPGPTCSPAATDTS